jgi:hypothetical protein
MLVMENPIVPEMVRAKLQGVISPRIRNWMNVPGILQRWYMFTAPGLEASTILIAARRPDGSLVDPIRNIPFDPQAPFRQSSYLGKYWVSYFYQLRQSGYGLYREPFAQWLFKQGYEEVFLQDASRTIPATCQGAPSPLHVSTIFRAFKPFVVKPRLKDVQIQNATTISVREQNMRKFGPGWTSDMQVHADFRHGSSELLIRFSSKRACRAQGEFFFTYAPDYGRFDISVNEGPQTLLDLYTPFGVLRRSVSIGALALREGENTIRIALRSDTDPVRTKFGIDEVSFRCEE